eukprot:gene3495-6143_t
MKLKLQYQITIISTKNEDTKSNPEYCAVSWKRGKKLSGTTKKQTPQDDSRLVGTSYIFNENFTFNATLESKISLKQTTEYKTKSIEFHLNEVDSNEKVIKMLGTCHFDLSTVISTRKEIDLEFKEKVTNIFKKNKLNKTLKFVVVSTPLDEEGGDSLISDEDESSSHSYGGHSRTNSEDPNFETFDPTASESKLKAFTSFQAPKESKKISDPKIKNATVSYKSPRDLSQIDKLKQNGEQKKKRGSLLSQFFKQNNVSSSIPSTDDTDLDLTKDNQTMEVTTEEDRSEDIKTPIMESESFEIENEKEDAMKKQGGFKKSPLGNSKKLSFDEIKITKSSPNSPRVIAQSSSPRGAPPTQTNDDLEKSIQKKKTFGSFLKRKNSENKTDVNASLLAENLQHEQKIKELEREKEKLKSEIKDLELELEIFQKRIIELQSLISKNQTDHQDKEIQKNLKENEKLKEELEYLKEELEKLVTNKNDVGDGVGDIGSSSSSVGIDNQSTNNNELNDQIEILKRKNETLNKELKMKIEMNLNFEENLKKSKEIHQNQEIYYEKTIKDLKENKEMILNQLMEKESEIENMKDKYLKLKKQNIILISNLENANENETFNSNYLSEFISEKKILEIEIKNKNKEIKNLKKEKEEILILNEKQEESNEILNSLFWGLICSLFSVMAYSSKSDDELTKFGLKFFIIFSFITFTGIKFSKNEPLKIKSNLIQFIFGKLNLLDNLNKSILWGFSLGFSILIFDKLIFNIFLNIPYSKSSFLAQISFSMHQSIVEEIGIRFFSSSFLLKIFEHIHKFSKFVIQNEKNFQDFQIRLSKFMINLFKKKENLIWSSFICSFLIYLFYKIPVDFDIISTVNPNMSIFLTLISLLRIIGFNSVITFFYSKMIVSDESIELVILSHFFLNFILYAFGGLNQI